MFHHVMIASQNFQFYFQVLVVLYYPHFLFWNKVVQYCGDRLTLSGHKASREQADKLVWSALCILYKSGR